MAIVRVIVMPASPSDPKPEDKVEMIQHGVSAGVDTWQAVKQGQTSGLCRVALEMVLRP